NNQDKIDLNEYDYNIKFSRLGYFLWKHMRVKHLAEERWRVSESIFNLLKKYNSISCIYNRKENMIPYLVPIYLNSEKRNDVLKGFWEKGLMYEPALNSTITDHKKIYYEESNYAEVNSYASS